MRKFLSTLPNHDAPLAQTLDVLAAREIESRRRVLRTIGAGAAAFALLPTRSFGCVLIPSETGGPYPGDGTNGPNALTQTGIVRGDIRASFGASGTATAPGTVLTLTLRLVSTTVSCARLQGYAVYLWHCNATGGYSMYSSGVATQNYLRGVQVSNANGEVTFTTVFPGCYPGRWPHIHFEIYETLAAATNGANAIRTSQLALPEAACRAVYTQGTYGTSTNNINGVTLASDNVFGNDGGVLQLATATGDNTNGWASTLEVGFAGTPTIDADLVLANGFE